MVGTWGYPLGIGTYSAADAAPLDTDNYLAILWRRVGHVLNADVAFGVEASCSHCEEKQWPKATVAVATARTWLAVG